MTTQDEHDEYVVDVRRQLEAHLSASIAVTRQAVSTVRRLTGEAFDVEYEPDGGDVMRLLELAGSALAGAEALAKQRHR